MNGGRRKKLAVVSLVPVALALLLAACWGEPSPATTTANVEEILVSGPDAVDIGPASASIAAESKMDIVCAVAYGPTTDYGRTATDTDMAGGGIGTTIRCCWTWSPIPSTTTSWEG